MIATFYPVSGANSPMDGSISSGSKATWALARSATDGTAQVTDTINYLSGDCLGAGQFQIQRAFLLFDTSSLTAGAIISSATINLYGTSKAENQSGMATVHIVSSSPASNSTLAASDFVNIGSTSFANITYGSLVTSNYNVFTLDANGIANISKTGISKFGVRLSNDLNNNQPSSYSNVFEFRSADYTGTGSDPYLEVTYTLPSNLFAFF